MYGDENTDSDGAASLHDVLLKEAAVVGGYPKLASDKKREI